MTLAQVITKAMAKNPGRPEAVVAAVTNELAAVFNEEVDRDHRVQGALIRIMEKLCGEDTRLVDRAS